MLLRLNDEPSANRLWIQKDVCLMAGLICSYKMYVPCIVVTGPVFPKQLATIVPMAS